MNENLFLNKNFTLNMIKNQQAQLYKIIL